MKKIIITIIYVLGSLGLAAQEIVPLWNDDEIPNYRQGDEKEFIDQQRDIVFIEKVQKPTLEIFLPSAKNSKNIGVLVLPGGGYAGVAYDWEGTDYAKWFNSMGIAAFVLKYRMPQASSVIASYQAPIQDAQRAMRYIRSNAEKFNIDKNKVGVIGSSAGGHLASTLAMHDLNYYELKDDIDKEKKAPDFQMLIYPVVSMKKELTHMGSRNNLLGKNPDDALIQQFSNELNVKENTPVAFIIHSGNDKVVPVENSLRLYKSMLGKNVNTTMHIFPGGGHGYSLGFNNKNTPDWTSVAKDWLKQFD